MGEELREDVEQQGAEADQQLEARGGGQEGQLQEGKLPDQDGRQQEYYIGELAEEDRTGTSERGPKSWGSVPGEAERRAPGPPGFSPCSWPSWLAWLTDMSLPRNNSLLDGGGGARIYSFIVPFV